MIHILARKYADGVTRGENPRPKSPTTANERALALVSRLLAEGYVLALHGLEIEADHEDRIVHLRPRSAHERQEGSA